MTTPKDAKPHTVLIAAMGGEGGGVLSNWLVRAATKAGRIVQSTSIPGVAQRTGATTYYVEIWPESTTGEPISALYPTPGEVDIMVASELIEAGR
ncbi:MAG: 2-oxoacid:acceptor oxidoreductase family protein, partial [Alphaproteobacteria bacterium]